ncbi:MAG TPA: DUF1176 domain-containing protein [Sphingomicrobium sp.]
MLALIAAALVFAPVPKPAHFGNWIVACDNGRHCEALALPADDGSDSEWTLHVTRDAPGAALPSVEAAPAFEDPKAVRLRIDGRDTAFGFDRDGRAVGEPRALLAAIAAARKVEIVDAKSKAIATIPVSGASAALRWMDDRQKRAGTVTALIARGARPASDVPPAPPLPRIALPPVSKAPPRKLTAAAARAVRKGTNFCDDKPFEEVETYRLDAGHTVAIVPCMQHAYQTSYAVVVIDEAGKWRPAPIEQPEPPDKYWEASDAYVLIEAGYSEDHRLLSMGYKGRGLADCGMGASWAWDGKMFRLASYYALNECRGAPPGTWPSRWQTANDPLKEDQ